MTFVNYLTSQVVWYALNQNNPSTIHSFIQLFLIESLYRKNVLIVFNSTYFPSCLRLPGTLDLKKLKALTLFGEVGSQVNPLCQQSSSSYRRSVFKVLPNLCSLDGKDEKKQEVVGESALQDLKENFSFVNRMVKLYSMEALSD